MSGKRHWTDAERDLLEKYYPSNGTDVQALLPGRDRRSVRRKAQQQAIRTRLGRKVVWSTEEDQMIIDLFPIYGTNLSKYMANKSAIHVQFRNEYLKTIRQRN